MMICRRVYTEMNFWHTQVKRKKKSEARKGGKQKRSNKGGKKHVQYIQDGCAQKSLSTCGGHPIQMPTTNCVPGTCKYVCTRYILLYDTVCVLHIKPSSQYNRRHLAHPVSVEGSHHVGRGFARESGASNKKRYTWSLGSQQRVQSRYKGKAHYVMYRSAKLHGDLFSRHASPLEVYVFVAVDERGEHVMSDETGRRCNGKQ